MLLRAEDLPEIVPGRTCLPYAGAAAARLAGLDVDTRDIMPDGARTLTWLAAELVARGVDARRVIVPRGEALVHTPVIVVTHPPGGELHAVLVEDLRGPIAWTLDAGRCARLVDDLMREIVEGMHVVSESEAELGDLIPLLVAGDRALVRGVEVIRIYGAFGREETSWA